MTFTMFAMISSIKFKLKSTAYGILTNGVSWDGQDGARWDNHSLCAGMSALVEDQ